VAKLANTARWIVTTEEHASVGGLGTRCAHVIASLQTARARHLGIGLPRATHKNVGDQRFMRAQAGLTAERVVEAVRGRFENQR
jgi:transketolase C-terminal domain/subunit